MSIETTLYKVAFKDGRTFKVFCANKAQKNRFIKTMATAPIVGTGTVFSQLENGIHNIKQWEQIISKLN